MLLEKRDDCVIVQTLRNGQRRCALLRRPFNVRAFCQQQPRCVDVAVLTGDVQRRPIVLPRPINRGAFFQAHSWRVQITEPAISEPSTDAPAAPVGLSERAGLANVSPKISGNAPHAAMPIYRRYLYFAQ